MDITLILSIWGAALSTILCVVKVSEFFRSRFRICVAPILRGSQALGHELSIQNLSSRPVLLQYLEIFKKDETIPLRGEEVLWHPEDSPVKARIEPSDSATFYFQERDYFHIGPEGVYVRLMFAGGKTVDRKISWTQ